MSDPKVVFIVSHTHWDREWYFPFHRFRVNLLGVVDQVLDRLEKDPDFHHFVLDGQTALLEDYLEARPEDEARIRRLVENRSLSIGPWYILPDEFLVSAEATVRNLMIGHQTAAPFGHVQKVGYMPDSFGHIAQMPQILRLAGIDSFLYTRGNGDEIEETGFEYYWCAPDGSEVLATNQCGGYCNAGGLGFEELWHAHTRRTVDVDRAVKQVRELLEKMEPHSNSELRLLNNGCDHFPPQQEFGTILDRLRETFPDIEFRHASLEEYVEALKMSGAVQNRHQGELVSGRLHHILSGVWSARMHLKQRNDQAQTWLSDYTEPLAAYTHFTAQRRHPSGLLGYAWKLLLKNHPHDSICGCSTDEVHREMEPRFDGVIQTCEQIVRNELENLVPTFARTPEADRDTLLCVANPLPMVRSEVITRLVVLQPLGIEIEKLRLLDQKGRDVPFRILDRRYLERFWGIDYRTELGFVRQQEQLQTYLDHFGDRILKTDADRDEADCFLTIQFVAEDLPALGHAVYSLTDRSGTDGQRSENASAPGPAQGRADTEQHTEKKVVVTNGDTLENEFYQIRLHPDGSFDLHDKTTGVDYAGLNGLEDTEDIGDEYDYSPALETMTVTPNDAGGVVRITRDTGLSATIEASFPFSLPVAIDTPRVARDPRHIDCPTCVRVSLEAGSPIVDIHVRFDNRARDHRLRAIFPTPVVTGTVISDGHFYLNRRPIEQPAGTDWVQPPPGTIPQQDFSLLEDGERGFALLNKGLPEIEAKNGSTGSASLSLTLLRSVGWLSRDDFATRRFSNAGPTIHTPEAQCLGPRSFEYAIVTYGGDLLAADVKGISRRYKVPVLTLQGIEDQHLSGGMSLLRKQTTATSISAIKKHEIRDTLVLRLYNLTTGPVNESLFFGLPVRAAWRTDLLEQRIAEALVAQGNEVEISLGPHEIVTLEVDFEESSSG